MLQAREVDTPVGQAVAKPGQAVDQYGEIVDSLGMFNDARM